MNSTLCISQEGGSPISSSNQNSELMFFNIVDCADYCCIELTSKGVASISYTNFINTSNNDYSVINNFQFGEVTISYSTFFNSFERVFTDDTKINLVECTSNQMISGFNPTITEEFSLHRFKAIKFHGICEICVSLRLNFHKQFIYSCNCMIFFIIS